MSGKLLNNFKKGINMIETSVSEEQVCLGFIRLKFEIQKRNFYALLVYNLVFGFCLSGVELLQQNLLLSKDYFNFKPEEATQYNSFIVLFDLLTKLIVTPIYGTLIDKFGRRAMASAGFSLIVLSFIMFTPNNYPNSDINWYYFVRFLYANGAAITSVVPLCADYIEHDSQGRAIGLAALFAAFGLSLSTLIANAFLDYDISYTYIIFAGFIFSTAAFSCLFLKPGREYYRIAVLSPDKLRDPDSDVTTALQESSQLSKKDQVIQICKSRPWILIAYIFGFLNGICLGISSQILNLYVQSFNIPNGKHLGTSIVFKSNMSNLVTSLLVGPALDFIQPMYIALIPFALSIIAFFGILAVDDPNDLSLSLIATAVGIVYALSLLLSNYLGFKIYPPAMRGLLLSIATLCILFGVIFTTVIGGFLFNSGDTNWPFYIAGICSLLSFGAFVYIYYEMVVPKKEKIQAKQELSLSLLYTSIQTANSDPIADEEDTNVDLNE